MAVGIKERQQVTTTPELERLQADIARLEEEIAKKGNSLVRQIKLKNLQDALRNEQRRIDLLNQGRNPDGSWIRPEFESLIDPETGLLRQEYVIGADYKPVELNIQALEKYRQEALRDPGQDSEWARLMLEQQAQEEANLLDQASLQSRYLQQEMYDNLAAQGGLSSGSRERLARGALRDALRDRQGIRSAGAANRLNIRTQDEDRRMGQLQTLQNMEHDYANYLRGNEEARIRLQQANIENALREIQGGRQWELDTWMKNQETWAAEKQADAQRAASSGGGSGCCFIFLEARYGDGTMDEVVRRYRDEHMTDKNKRGYYKLSEVLVPLMRKSKLVKFLVRVTMTDPLVAYGKWYYRRKGIGFVFAPVKDFWMRLFNYLGEDHKFIRENGEVV